MGDGILGNRLMGITDALASSVDTIRLSLSLFLPFAGPILNVATSFVWWFLLASIAFTSGKILLRQANGQELAGKLGLGMVLLVVFFPIKEGDTHYKLPLASYVTINLIEMIDLNYRQGIDVVTSEMTNNDGRLPVSMIRTLNQNNLNAVDASRLAPIVSDYVANCTSATLKSHPDTGEPLSQRQWRTVGLFGSGALGFEPEDYREPESWLTKLLSNGLWSPMGGLGSELDELFESDREKAIQLLKQTPIPTNLRGYEFPTENYWNAKLNGEANTSIPNRTISLPDEARFLSTQAYNSYKANGQIDPREDLTKWYADDCYELYTLAQQGTRNYLKALQVSYADVFERNKWNISEQDAYAAGSHAVAEAMRNYYTRSANREAAGAEPGARPVSGFLSNDTDSGSYLKANGLSTLQGAVNDLASMLLNIGLDQWVISLLGSLSIAIAFIAVIFPFFALLAPITGGGAIVTPLKVMIMLELTLMLSYAIAALGLMLIAAINVVAVNSKFSAFGLGDGMTTLTVTVMTAMFIFPLFAAKLAHVLVFGSSGVGAADGKTVSLGKQAGLAGAVLGAAAALLPGKAAAMAGRAARQASKARQGHSNNQNSSVAGSPGGNGGLSSTVPRGTPASGRSSSFSRGNGRVASPNRRGTLPSGRSMTPRQ